MPQYPVYVGYTLYLERYVEVEAESMEEAIAFVKQQASMGELPHPQYTEGLADWTEVTDIVQSHLTVDGERFPRLR
jgi:hypothetical protein